MRMSSAGGLFTDGLQGMLSSAQGLGLTIGELTDVVTNNRESLAGLGMSVGEAARQMGEIGKMIPNNTIRQLRMLGINAKDQADAMADVMKDMRVSRNFNMQDAAQRQQIADQTAIYAQNLKTLSAITGEDAKRKTEETRKANMVLAFQQKLSNLDPTAISNINLGMSTMSREMQQAVREQTVYGRIVTPELAVMAQQMPAFGAAVQESAEAVQAGTLDQKRALDIQAKNSEAMQRQALGATAIGRGGMAPGADGLLRGTTEGMANQLQRARDITEESVKNAQQQQRDLTANPPPEGGGPLATTRAMVDAAQAGRELALMIQKELLGPEGPMKMFASGVRDMTTAMATALEFFVGPRNKNELPQPNIQPGNPNTPSQLGELLSQLGDGLKNIFRDAGNIIAETIGRALGSTPTRQLAMGGVISGDPKGFLATLHGNEAVIPLPDSLRGPEFAQAMQNLIDQDKAGATATNGFSNADAIGFTDAFDRITKPAAQDQIEVLTNIKDLMEEMVNYSRSIAGHTELTAVRVS
jgi:hypothetical protein